QAEMQAARIRVGQAEVDNTRMAALQRRGNVAAEEKNITESALGVARAQLDQFTAELKSIEIRIKYVERRRSMLARANTTADPAPKADEPLKHAPPAPGENQQKK